MQYTILIEKTPNNFSAYAPDLPGCVATAGTYEEVLSEMRQAMAFHIDGMAEDGEPIPPPQTRSATIDLTLPPD